MLTAAIMLLVLGVCAAHAQVTVTAAWDRNTDAYTAGYRLYYGTGSGSYTWSVDAGNQVTTPLNLSSGNVYYFVVRAYNATYQEGPASAETSINLTTPAPTAQITATLQGTNVAVVSWSTTNAVSASINGIAVATSGSTSTTINATTTFTIRAVAADGRTATASATVSPVNTSTAPGVPRSLTSSVSGSTVTLGWQPPNTGGSVSNYLVYVGTASGWSDVVNAYNVGNTLRVSGSLGRGSYYARVRAANAAGTSLSSNEVSFRIGRRLRTPTSFTVSWQGSMATLSWTAGAADTTEDVPTNYVLEAGTGPGLRNVATLRVGNVTRYSTPITAGTYYVRVRAENEYGDSDPSNEIELRAAGSPQAPTNLIAGGSGATVDLRWTAPTGGYPETGYIIEAGSAPGLSDLATIRLGDVTRFTTTAPPGVYYVRVRAVNASGAGYASNEIVVRR